MKVIIITGPTATGKTVLGAMLAKEVNGEVVSADSMQVYKYMNIGTAKPTAEEMLGIAHHMIDFVDPREDYSAARYVREATHCVDDILKRGKLPIIVGGTGLYINSLIFGRDFPTRGNESLRQELEAKYDELGGEAMLQRLGAFDPMSAEKLHFNDKKRIVRAIEAYMTTGKTISQHDIESMSIPPRYKAVKFALTFADRAKLYERIDRRVDTMVSMGLPREVQELMDMGVSPGGTAMQAIGYKELVDVIMEKTSVEDAVEKIKMESRRYAKRQLSWLRRDESVKWLKWENKPAIEAALGMFISLVQRDEKPLKGVVK